jgi:2-polyprenyl-3-methyl-5-hydroxy-6-metoxy-1,4-benzoquinol methylase
MLNSRFKNNGKNIINLNEKQKKFRDLFEEKITKKQYVFENVNCIICNSSNFELLSEKDRYGLSMSVVICKKCGLVQTSPRMNENTIREFYNNEYREIYEKGESVTERSFQAEYDKGKVINNFITNVTNEKIIKKFVVEIGTGSGGILQFFKDAGNEIFGVDLDSKCIQFGKNKGLNLDVGTLQKLSEIKKHPDLVIYSHVLEHLSNPIEELKTIKKFLHPSSILYVEVPGLEHLDLSYHQNFLEYLQNAHLYHFTLNSLCNCVKRSGFEIISGNKIIHSLFKIGKIDETYSNDYQITIKFLQNLEKLQTNSWNLMKIKGKIFSAIFRILVFSKTLHIGQSIYSKYSTKKKNK